MLRRNGTRSSCEPCRKAKVKCDHRSPFCQRCETRGISALCVYHPAPLTRSPAPEARRTHKLSKQQYQSGFLVLDLSGDGLSESAFPSTQVSFTAPGAAPPAATQITYTPTLLPTPYTRALRHPSVAVTFKGRRQHPRAIHLTSPPTRRVLQRLPPLATMAQPATTLSLTESTTCRPLPQILSIMDLVATRSLQGYATTTPA
jgi:hypothetical protein